MCEDRKRNVPNKPEYALGSMWTLDSSGNPLASAWELKSVYIPVEFLGKSRALCALKTMTYGAKLPLPQPEKRERPERVPWAGQDQTSIPPSLGLFAP